MSAAVDAEAASEGESGGPDGRARAGRDRAAVPGERGVDGIQARSGPDGRKPRRRRSACGDPADVDHDAVITVDAPTYEWPPAAGGPEIEAPREADRLDHVVRRGGLDHRQRPARSKRGSNSAWPRRSRGRSGGRPRRRSRPSARQSAGWALPTRGACTPRGGAGRWRLTCRGRRCSGAAAGQPGRKPQQRPAARPVERP